MDVADDRSVIPVNIAHRGASAYAPEHTLAAYQLALEMGADYVEQDLQVTKDGILVCLHDATLERTTDVEKVYPNRAVEIDREGVRHRVWRVSDFTLAEIKQLDAGSWFASDFLGATVPTFQEAIDLLQGGAGLYIETKDSDTYEKLEFSMEAEIVRVLAENGFESGSTPIYIQSFSAQSLKRVKNLVGSMYPLLQLVRTEQALTLMSDKGLLDVSTYATGVGPPIAILLEDPSRAVAVRSAGLDLHPYTVRANSLPELFSSATAYMTYLFEELGATGVFTDNPDLFPRHAISKP